MDYSIFNERLTGISGGTFSVVAELIASSSETIPYYSEVSGRILAPGSIAVVPSETAIYVLDTDLLWTEWGTGSKIPAPEDDDAGSNEI